MNPCRRDFITQWRKPGAAAQADTKEGRLLRECHEQLSIADPAIFV